MNTTYTMTHTIQSLIKGDADAYYYQLLNNKEYAFKVLQERVYPAIHFLQSQGIQIPTLLSTKAGQ
jgi:hypothetical protein